MQVQVPHTHPGQHRDDVLDLLDESERNVKGEELATCLHLYDTGGERDDDRDLETKLVFLDETRSTGYSRGHTHRHPRGGSPVRSRPTYSWFRARQSVK